MQSVGGRGIFPIKPPPHRLVLFASPGVVLVPSTGGGTIVVFMLAAPVNLFVDAAPPRRCLLLFVVSSHPCRVVWLATVWPTKSFSTRERLVQQIAKNIG